MERPSMKVSRKLFILIFVLTLIFILVDTYLNLQKITRQQTAELCSLEKIQTHSETKRIPFNQDEVFWIKIPGTAIDYPVMFTPDRVNYYLDHDYYKNTSAHGLPFISSDWSEDSLNILIYAHNMRDGSLFHDLINYTDQSFLKTHNKIILSSMNKTEIYEVFAVVKTQISENSEFPFFRFSNIRDKDSYNFYSDLIKDQAIIYCNSLRLNFPVKLLTVSTCSYHVDNGRLCVIAVQVNS